MVCIVVKLCMRRTIAEKGFGVRFFTIGLEGLSSVLAWTRGALAMDSALNLASVVETGTCFHTEARCSQVGRQSRSSIEVVLDPE